MFSTPASPTSAPIGPSPLDIYKLPSLWEKEETMQWIIPNFLAKGSVNLITSESGTGKTWLAYFLAGAIARGGLVLGHSIAPQPVLYLDGENPRPMVTHRMGVMGLSDHPNLRVWGGWQEEEPKGPADPRIVGFAEAEKPLLIWDSLIEFHPGDEQSATETRAFMKHFRKLANLGATVIILHHTGKSKKAQEYRGSTDIKASVDVAYTCRANQTSVGRVTKLTGLRLEPFKCRLFCFEPISLKLIEGRGFEVTGSTNPLEALRQVIQSADRGAGVPQAVVVRQAQSYGLSKHTVEELLANRAEFEWTRGRGKAKLYRLKTSPLPTSMGEVAAA